MWPALLLVMLAAPPRVALLSTSGGRTELRYQPVGARELSAVVASLEHAEGSSVLGAVVGKVVVATATRSPGLEGPDADLSFGSALYRLAPGLATRQLVDRVAVSSRPVVGADGHVYVQRGRAGPGRVDELTVDEVDVETGQVRTVYATQGFVTFVVSVLGRELVVYDVTPRGGRVVLVHLDSLAVREVQTLAPLAHDLVLDAPRRRLFFTLGEVGRERYSLVQTDLVAPFATRVLAVADEVTLLPTPWPDGRVLRSAGAGHGLVEVGGDAVVLAAHGPGYERVRAFVDGIAVGLLEVPSDFPRPFAVKGGVELSLVGPAQQRLDVAGVLP
jgi:hypothetical protein